MGNGFVALNTTQRKRNRRLHVFGGAQKRDLGTEVAYEVVTVLVTVTASYRNIRVRVELFAEDDVLGSN